MLRRSLLFVRPLIAAAEDPYRQKGKRRGSQSEAEPPPTSRGFVEAILGFDIVRGDSKVGT